MNFVTVYRFKVWNYELGVFGPSPRLATRAAIERLGAEVIEDSEKSVPPAKIDGNGFLKSDEVPRG